MNFSTKIRSSPKLVRASLAAQAGLGRSQYVLGKIYLHGRGVTVDEAKGRAWIEKAAQQGHERAQYNMGKITRDGIGGTADIAAAAQWFLRAAKKGYAKAQNHIGTRYARGEGIEKNEAEALFWLTLAARQKNWTAEVNRKALAAKLPEAIVLAATKRADHWKPE